MWHKLFKSKSAKVSTTEFSNAASSEFQTSNITSSEFERSTLNNLNNNTSNEMSNKRPINKFTNAFKRVTLKRAHSAGSNSNKKKQNGKNKNYNDDDDDEDELSVLENIPGFRESSISNTINIPQREFDDRYLTSFSTFRVGSAEFNSPTPEPRQLFVPETPEPVDFGKLIEQLDVIPSTNIQLELEPCPICTRKFVPESLAKHVGICEKMAMKKRKVFDSSKQRIEGTELASYRPPPQLPGVSTTQKQHSVDSHLVKVSPPKTTPLPRKFERTPSLDRTPMKDIMTSSSANSKSSTIKRVTNQSQSEMCPYCERTFGFKAYDRHVEWCKEKAYLKQMSSNNKETVSAAKERLQARIKYKAPCVKTKRQLTREKYSGGSLSCSGSTNSLNDIGTSLFKQKDYACSVKGDKKNSFSMANSMTSSMTSERKNLENNLLNRTKQVPSSLHKNYMKNNQSISISQNRNISKIRNPKVKSDHALKNTTAIKCHLNDFQAKTKYPEINYQKKLNYNDDQSPPLFNSKCVRKKNVGYYEETQMDNETDFDTSSMCNSDISLVDPIHSNNYLKKAHASNTTGLSDRNYDPFVSAKRQLEELFSPTTNNNNTTTLTHNTANNITNNTNKSSTNINKKNNNTNLMTSSMKVTPITTKTSAPNNSLPNRSNFRRASSLRLSKKVSKPLFSQNTRSNIQRGLSPDDGPVSPHFVRANEYDEIPVKSAYNALQGMQQNENLISSNKSSTPIRATPPKTPIFDETPIFKRMNSSELRKNLKLELRNPNTTTNQDFSVSKTDSLAAFLKYEKDLKDSSSCLSEKDLKDKSNTCLSKRSSIINESKENIVENNERLPEIKTSNAPTTAPTTPNNNNTRISPIGKLEPIQKNKLNNYNNHDIICDVLSLKVTKLSDSDNSSTGSSTASAKSTSKRDDTPEKLISSNRNSTERRNVLRRQMKLNKDNILYDLSPDSDPYSEECDKNISQLEAERDNNPKFKRNISSDTANDLESIFDDFDFDEFISSFEDDENYPIFKDYKNILLSRTINDSKNISNDRSEIDSNFEEEKTPRNEKGNNNNEIKVPVGLKVNLDDLSPVEKDLLKSVNELNDMCNQNMYPVDSDDLSSIEGFPLRKLAGSKMSADSAYGSLSRQSPPERASNRRTTKARAMGTIDMLKMPDIQQHNKHQGRHSIRPRDNNLSMSSSGSESSLPPISSNLKTHKMELHPHNEKVQSNNNNNNYNSSGSDCKLSKFCHECGARFKLASAKFCMDCGVKRIVIE
uniref:CSON001673 protein n=1 Tax=Culicoides sonorensis TaxID=179676 RepID=A0A336MIL1_CULSO